MNIKSLSDEQSSAAYSSHSQFCILAGAGSGKTRVITHRIAHLVKNCGANPKSILGVTFTNKAAQQMRDRVYHLIPESKNDIVLGTFHGLAARFLRIYGPIISIPSDFLIYDEDDSLRVIKKIIKEKYQLSKDETKTLINKVRRLRSNEKLAHDESNSISCDQGEEVLSIYDERLKKANALDFFMLLKSFLTLLKDEEGRRAICSRIQHVVVDEYQDINHIQSQIVTILANHAKSCAIVGDDDQSIYGWRGASFQYMQDFLSHFKEAQLFKLQDNYRSTTPILNGANALIANNEDRLGKDLRSMSGDGELIGLKRYIRDSHEAMAIVDQSLQLFERFGSGFEIAVLMRTNAQSRPLEEALSRARVPYKMVGGMRFYDRREIKDVLAALKTVLYPRSDVDVFRVLETFPFGIGKKTLDKISAYAGLNGLSIYQVMAQKEHKEKAIENTRSNKKIDEFITLITEMNGEILKSNKGMPMPADEALVYIVDKFLIAKRLIKQDDDESHARLENIEQLIQAASSFVKERSHIEEDSDIQAFLEHVALISKDDMVTDKSQSTMGSITLMTLHAAKGLEFDAVFLIGLEEGVLPHSRSIYGFDDEKRRLNLEEERRLMYVGMTRAKKLLHLSFCQERFMHGRTNISLPSRFIKELPKDTIAIKDRFIIDELSYNDIKSSNEYHYEEAVYEDFSYEKPSKNEAITLSVGMKVMHKKYHKGTVISLSGSGKLLRAKVRFDGQIGIKTILASHLVSA